MYFVTKIIDIFTINYCLDIKPYALSNAAQFLFFYEYFYTRYFKIISKLLVLFLN